MGFQTQIQTGLFSILDGASLGADVYDIAPQQADGASDSVFPYVTIGRVIVNSLDTQTTNGVSFVARIHTFTRGGTMLPCKTIQDSIYTALHRQSLTLTGFSNFLLLRIDTDAFPEGDGKVHGVCEYRGLVETA